MAERIDRIGQRFGDYWLRRRLGGGGFGDVYLGEQVHEHSLAAVKVLHRRLTRSEELRAFINEVRTFRLQHPHIVRVLDVGIAKDETPFLVMAYAPGGTLRDRHPKGSLLSQAQVLLYVLPIASALQYAHDLHLIHRDVKPENMLLGARGELWLSDFGIATVAHSTHSLTTEGIGGTLPYMAPEQIQGRPRPQSDQYALAIVVYEWLTGTWPFRGTAIEIAMQHQMTPPPALRTQMPTLAPEVEQVVLTALAKEPKQRFASVLDFARALEQASQAEQSTLVEPPSVQPPPAALQMPVTLPPVPLMHDAKSGLLQQEERRRSAEEAEQARLAEEERRRSAEEERVHTIEEQTSPLSAAPTQSPPQAFASDSTRSETAQQSQAFSTDSRDLLSINSAGQGQQQATAQPRPRVERFSPTGTQARTSSPVSPDLVSHQKWSRRSILALGTGGIIVGGSIIWLVSSLHHFSGTGRSTPPSSSTPTVPPTPTLAPLGTTLVTYSGHSETIQAVAWSPNGKWIVSGSGNSLIDAVVSHDNTVQVWDALTGTPVAIYKDHSAPVVAVAWSPDSHYIASAGLDKTVQVWSATTGKRLLTYSGHSQTQGSAAKGRAGVYSVAWSPDGKQIASADIDHTVQIWDRTTGSNLFTYSRGSAPMSWSPNGKYIVSVSASDQEVAEVWDSTSGHVLATHHNQSIAQNTPAFLYAFAWSHESKNIASTQNGGPVEVWDALSGHRLLTYAGFPSRHGSSTAVAWSPDNTHIVSADNFGAVQLWESATGKHIYTHMHSGGVQTVAWSPDGTRIASGGYDQRVEVWQAV